jgi:hypothetical protein
MNTLCIELVTPKGDNVGRLPLDDVVIAAPGELTSATKPGAQMADIYKRIQEVITKERMTLAMRPLDFELAVSRAVLSAHTGDTTTIQLAVQPLKVDEPAANRADNPTLPKMDDMFDLNDPKENRP